jgi:hypothetical protein
VTIADSHAKSLKLKRMRKAELQRMWKTKDKEIQRAQIWSNIAMVHPFAEAKAEGHPEFRAFRTAIALKG